MKKILLFLLTVVLFSACGDQITEVTEVVEPISVSEYITIQPQQWYYGTDATGPYYYYEISMPKLTDEVLDKGVMNAYYRYHLDDNDKVDRFALLPYVDYYSDDQVFFTAEFALKQVTILYKSASGNFAPQYPYSFAIRLLW
jgi:hypothetical protein